MSNIIQNNSPNKRTNDNMNENELLESSENSRIEPLNKKLKLNITNNDENNKLPSIELILPKNKIIDLSEFINKSTNKYTYINNKLSIQLFINDNIFVLVYGIGCIYNELKFKNKFNKVKFDYINQIINDEYVKFFDYLIQINMEKNKSLLHCLMHKRTYNYYKNNNLTLTFVINKCFINDNNEIYKNILCKFEELINYSIKILTTFIKNYYKIY